MTFPKLIPAFTVQVVLDASVSIGAVSSTGPLTLAPFTPNAGSLKSESGYPVQVDAVFLHGSDLIRQDASGKHVRLDVNSVLKDKSGALIKFTYEGLINVNAETGAVLMGSPEAKTTGFGDATTFCKFETGSEELREIEQHIYVGSGRFIVEHGKGLIVEYKISQVSA